MFGNKKRFEELNKEITALKDRVELLEFEKENPNGLKIIDRNTGILYNVGDTVLKYIKNGKVKEFTLEKASLYINSTWELDKDVLINTITERTGFSWGVGTNYKTTTKKYKFDIENERLIELRTLNNGGKINVKTIEPIFEKIAEEKVKEDIVEMVTNKPDNKPTKKSKTTRKRKSKTIYNSDAGKIMLDNKDAIVELKNKGYTNKQIAEKYGVGITSVWRLLNNKTSKAKVKLTKKQENRKLLESEMGNILKARENGVTIKELSEKYGIAKTTIRDAIERHKNAKIQNNIIADLESDGVDYRKNKKFGRQYD